MAATVAAEAGDFLPQEERLDKRAAGPLFEAQMRYWPSGYYGRGYIQLTWQKNYEAAGKALGIDLAGSPALALEPAIAAKVAAWFFKANGIHKHCLGGDWEAARRAVAGSAYHKDRAALRRFLGHCNRLGCSFGGGGAKW
jgi:hypothetical protein